jgi:CBS domain-containing protein
LFSTDELERWWEIEDELAAIETQAAGGGEAALAAVADKTRELVKMTSAFLEQHANGNVSLSTPAHRLMTVARCACLATDSVSHAARLMADEDCAALPVLDTAGLLVGMVTDRELRAYNAQPGASEQQSVVSAISKPAYGVRADAPLTDVICRMQAQRVQCVPVVADGGRLMGLISLADLFRHFPVPSSGSGVGTALVNTFLAISEPPPPPSRENASAAE